MKSRAQKAKYLNQTRMLIMVVSTMRVYFYLKKQT